MQAGPTRSHGGNHSGDVSPRSESSDVLASHQSFSLEMSKISIGGDFDDSISDGGSDTSRSATDKDGTGAEEAVKAVEVVETKAEPVVAEQVKKKPLTEAELDEIVILEVFTFCVWVVAWLLFFFFYSLSFFFSPRFGCVLPNFSWFYVRFLEWTILCWSMRLLSCEKVHR
jgi:hypothetical protein